MLILYTLWLVILKDCRKIAQSIQLAMRKIMIWAVTAIMVTLNAGAQTLMAGQTGNGRISCTEPSVRTRADKTHPLPFPYDFDSTRTYRQAVLLVSFSDMDFLSQDPVGYYNRLFNEPGFNELDGPGCVADYFRQQSRGRLNLQFDIYGPVKISAKAGDHTTKHPMNDYAEATRLLCEKETADFSVYDWNGDNEVEQLIMVFAGYSGNNITGYTYPNTGYGVIMNLPGGTYTECASVSCERWPEGIKYGVGTIVHEFCHSLGLPDIYPVSWGSYSVVDEWDLMDGGNYTNYGWCPPNLSAMELMYLGWNTPIELTEPTTVTGMKSLSDGGETYIIRSKPGGNEFYMLENRQQTGWDYGVPGNGLMIYHVDFDQEKWVDNAVNANDLQYRYQSFCADGKDFRTWCSYNPDDDINRWTKRNRLRSKYLSTAPYPYADPVSLVIIDALTDDSNPAATLYHPADDGRKFMGKAITNIRMADDGTISFDFMQADENGIRDIIPDNEAGSWYDLNGRRLDGRPTQPGIYIHYNSLFIKKTAD